MERDWSLHRYLELPGDPVVIRVGIVKVLVGTQLTRAYHTSLYLSEVTYWVLLSKNKSQKL